jgi:hypothetical protein
LRIEARQEDPGVRRDDENYGDDENKNLRRGDEGRIKKNFDS